MRSVWCLIWLIEGHANHKTNLKIQKKKKSLEVPVKMWSICSMANCYCLKIDPRSFLKQHFCSKLRIIILVNILFSLTKSEICRDLFDVWHIAMRWSWFWDIWETKQTKENCRLIASLLRLREFYIWLHLEQIHYSSDWITVWIQSEVLWSKSLVHLSWVTLLEYSNMN